MTKMTPTEYIEAAIQTGGYQSKFYGELVPMRIFRARLEDFARSADMLDKIKKSFFYGRDNAFAWLAGGEPDCTQVKGQEAIDMFHGIIGIATEAGELVETLFKGGEIDKVNIKEELGDVLWYIAVLCKTLDMSFEDIMETNIAKLRLRFPDKFNEYDANNRNLDAERELLEKMTPLQELKGRVENG